MVRTIAKIYRLQNRQGRGSEPAGLDRIKNTFKISLKTFAKSKWVCIFDLFKNEKDMKTKILSLISQSKKVYPLTEARKKRYMKALKSANESIEDAIKHGEDLDDEYNREYVAEKAICEAMIETGK